MTAFYYILASYETYQKIVDACVSGMKATEKLRKKFLLEMIERKPAELDNLADHKIPHGNLEEAKVFTFLHWSKPPKSSSPSTHPLGPAESRFEAYTFNIVEMMLPGLRFRVLHECICKSMHISGKDGRHLANDKLYGHLPQQLFVD